MASPTDRLMVLAIIFTLLQGCQWPPGYRAAAPGAASAASREPPPNEDAASLRDLAISRSFVYDQDSQQIRFTGAVFQITLDSFYFKPDKLILPAGQIVRIDLYNPSPTTHYFGGHAFFQHGAEILDIDNSEEPAQPGVAHHPVAAFSKSSLYLFTKAPGTYPLECFVPVHRQQGMLGSLIVE